MRRIHERVSPAMVVACLALLVALGGTSVAAVKLARNTVGTAQLKNNAVTSPKVKNHSLLRVDFANGQVPAGPRGAAGPAGPAGARGPTGAAGPAGAAAKWALIGRDGNLIAGSPGTTVTHPTAGNYYVNFGSILTGHAVVAAHAYRDGDTSFRGGIMAAICGGGTEGATCTTSNTTSTVHVMTENTTNNGFADHAFYVAVI